MAFNLNTEHALAWAGFQSCLEAVEPAKIGYKDEFQLTIIGALNDF